VTFPLADATPKHSPTQCADDDMGVAQCGLWRRAGSKRERGYDASSIAALDGIPANGNRVAFRSRVDGAGYLGATSEHYIDPVDFHLRKIKRPARARNSRWLLA
jgi:hypothetical protein